jgi:N-acetylmuramoyl-L-alanine amidase
MSSVLAKSADDGVSTVASCTAGSVLFVVAAELCVRVMGAPAPVNGLESSMKIVIDAGHGGIDSGVSGKITKVKESEINLSIVYFLKNSLEEFGFDVYLTRKTEAGLYDVATKGFKKRDMQKRKEIIEGIDPAMVISIHQNFYPSKVARGGQVFHEKGNAGGKLLADGVQSALNELYLEEGVKGRKVTEGEFFILSCATCPSILVECGFLSNPREEQLLRTQAYQQRLCCVIACTVSTWLWDT